MPVLVLLPVAVEVKVDPLTVPVTDAAPDAVPVADVELAQASRTPVFNSASRSVQDGHAIWRWSGIIRDNSDSQFWVRQLTTLMSPNSLGSAGHKHVRSEMLQPESCWMPTKQGWAHVGISKAPAAWARARHETAAAVMEFLNIIFDGVADGDVVVNREKYGLNEKTERVKL